MRAKQGNINDNFGGQQMVNSQDILYIIICKVMKLSARIFKTLL